MICIQIHCNTSWLTWCRCAISTVKMNWNPTKNYKIQKQITKMDGSDSFEWIAIWLFKTKKIMVEKRVMPLSYLCLFDFIFEFKTILYEINWQKTTIFYYDVKSKRSKAQRQQNKTQTLASLKLLLFLRFFFSMTFVFYTKKPSSKYPFPRTHSNSKKYENHCVYIISINSSYVEMIQMKWTWF